MSQFAPAFSFLMQHEDPRHLYEWVRDNRGNVISGINSLAFPADFEAISGVPQAQRGPVVSYFYMNHFWLPLQLGSIVSQDVANRVSDFAVNAGMKEAVLCIQRAVNLLRGNLTVDGKIGPETTMAVNACDPEPLLAAFRETKAQFRAAEVASHPEDAHYLPVWGARDNA